MLVWNPNLYPPGGYVFIDADGIRHRGKNIEDLATNIADYRVRRGMDPGNVAAEVHEYLCARYPNRCQSDELPSAEIIARTRANGITLAVAVWLRETWRKLANRKLNWVRDEVVQARAKICEACPFHQVTKSDCQTCNESLNQISFQLRAGRDRFSTHLQTCSHYERDARVDVLFEQPIDPAAPAFCWKRGWEVTP